MPRKNLIRTSEHPYHVTIRCNNKEWFDLPLEEVWFYSLESLKIAKKKYPVKIQAFVLMGNHYHLMIWTPNVDLDKFMFVFNSYLSRFIRKKTKRINRIFGDRYKWTLINDDYYYDAVLRYIYQNPLRAEVVTKCEHYKFSTLNSEYRNLVDLNLKIELTDIFINWVNEVPDTKNTKCLKRCLKKPTFN